MRIDPAGWPFVVGLGVAALAAAFWSPWLALIPLLLLAFTVNFFRDPERRVPTDSALILAPACGRVIVAGHSTDATKGLSTSVLSPRPPKHTPLR